MAVVNDSAEAQANGATAKSPDNTARKQDTRFKPGQSGNPAGRPKGSRNKLSEEFLAEVYADWCQNGAAALKKVRENRPDVYAKVVASLMPRQLEAEFTGPTHEDRVAELMERLTALDAAKA